MAVVPVNQVPPDAVVESLGTYLHDRGFADAAVVPIEPGIEDTFMALMGTPEAAS